MKKAVLSILVGGIIAAAAVMAFANPFAGAGTTTQTKLIAELSATNDDPLASGKTKWEERFEGAALERRRTSTEVEDVSTTGNHQVLVKRGDPAVVIATMTVSVDALGFGDLNLDSRDGDTVEILAAGDSVEVRNPNGVLILTGTLQEKQ